MLHANGNQQEVEIAILMPDKIDFTKKKKKKIVSRDKEGHYIMIKASSQEKDKMIIKYLHPK